MGIKRTKVSWRERGRGERKKNDEHEQEVQADKGERHQELKEKE